MDVFLKGFYGYKNFGDEMMLFSVLNRIHKHYDISKVSVEAGNPEWLHAWITKNSDYLGKVESKIHIVPVSYIKPKVFGHFARMMGMAKDSYDIRFFGGGEVLDEKRRFPHDGRNLFLLYRNTIKSGDFILLGGLGSNKTRKAKLLHKKILPTADKIVCRDQFSYELAKKYFLNLSPMELNKKIEKYHDFTLEMLLEYQDLQKDKRKRNMNGDYILVTMSPLCAKRKHKKIFKEFIKSHPDHRVIFFPTNLNEDKKYYDIFKSSFPEMEYFDRSQKSLDQILSLFYHAKAGVGGRLHFLYPLAVFGKPYEILKKTHKLEVNLQDLQYR